MLADAKLYVILRATLDSGLKMAQAIHAFKAFGLDHPRIEKEWFDASNNIAVLEYEDLDDLAGRLERHGMALARFYEPDRAGELTAICVEPAAKRLVRHVPLAA